MTAHKRCTIMTHSGFSLIELLVVISIIAIGSSMAIFGFNSYQVKSNVERQVREMATDMNDLRIRALTTKQRHSMVLYPNYYVMKWYSSETYVSGTDLVTYGNTLPGGNHNVKYGLQTSVDNSTGFAIELNQRGMLTALPQTIYLTGASTTGAAFNCLTIHTVRVNIGKQNATTGVCDDI